MLCKGIDFRTNPDDTITIHYKPDELKSFYFPSGNMLFEQVVYTPKSNKDSSEKKFAAVMLTGYLSLYKIDMLEKESISLFGVENDYVYVVKDSNNKYTVLRETENLEGDKYYLNKDYLQTLYKIITQCDSIRYHIKDIEFTDRDIKALFIHYNACASNTKTIEFKHKSKTILNHGITLSYYSCINQQSASSNGAFSVGYFIDLFNSSILENTTLTTGINYINGNSNNLFGDIGYSVPFIAKINLSKKRNAFYINTGITNYFYFPFVYIGFTGNIGIGTTINNKFFFSLNAEEYGPFLSSQNTMADLFLNFKFGVYLK